MASFDAPGTESRWYPIPAPWFGWGTWWPMLALAVVLVAARVVAAHLPHLAPDSSAGIELVLLFMTAAAVIPLFLLANLKMQAMVGPEGIKMVRLGTSRVIPLEAIRGVDAGGPFVRVALAPALAGSSKLTLRTFSFAQRDPTFHDDSEEVIVDLGTHLRECVDAYWARSTNEQ